MAYIPQTPAVAKSIADKYAATAEYLQKRHDATVAAASELKANIAALPLNEAEGEWRNNIVNAIDERLNNIDIGGFVGYGFNDIVKATGDIASSPAMIGRLQAQKDYTDFQNEIKSRQDLTELEKEYFLTKNPYYYQDKVNDKGQIVNGTKWQPTERALTKVDFTKVLDKAKEWAAFDSNSGSTVHFVDENGEETTDLSRIKDAYYFNTITSENIYLGKDKIKQAIDAAIASTPGAIESLAQDYKIAVWAAKNKGINDGVIGKDGLPISSEEYLAIRTNPFINATSYRKTKYANNIEETELGKQRARALSSISDNNIGYNSIPEVFSSPSAQTVRGGLIEQSTDEFKKSQERGTEAKNRLNYLVGPNVTLNYNLNDTDFKNSIKDLFANGILNEDEYSEAMAYTNQILSAKHRKDFVFSDATGRDKERHNFIELYNAGLPIDESTGKIGEKYNNLLKQIWKGYDGENATSIGYALNNKLYNDFIARIGGEDKFKLLGGVVADNNGTKFIKLPYNYKENTGLVLMTLKASIENLNVASKTPLYRFNEEDNIISNSLPYTTTSLTEDDEPFVRFIAKQQIKEDKYLNNHPIYASTTVLDAGSLEELNYKNNAKVDVKNAQNYLKLANEEQETAIRNILNTDFNQYNVRSWDNKKERFVDINGDGLKTLNQQIHDINMDTTKEKQNYTIQTGLIQDELGNIDRVITIVDNKTSGKSGGKVYRYLQPLEGGSKAAIDAQNDTKTLTTRSLGELNLYNEPINIAGIQNTSIKLYNRNDNHNDNIYSISFNGQDDIALLNRNEAFDLTETSIKLERMLDFVDAGITPDINKYAALARNVANTYARYGLVNANVYFTKLLERAGIEIKEQ